MNELTRISIAGAILLVALAILYVKKPLWRPILNWAWLILAGAGLNLAAIIGNGGMMPYLHIMSKAWWVWLGDWICWIASPGDILIFIGGFGMIATFLISRRIIYKEMA